MRPSDPASRGARYGASGSRLTRYRQAVLEVLRRSHDHPDAAALYRRVREHDPTIGLATVYRALNFLAQNGFIQELKHGDGASRFDGNVQEHAHVVCSRCGTIADVGMAFPADLARQAAGATGFDVQGWRAEFYGLCPACLSGQAC